MSYVFPQRIIVSLILLLLLGVLVLFGVNGHVTSTFTLQVRGQYVKELILRTAELETQYMELASLQLEDLEEHGFEVITSPRLIKRVRAFGFVTESDRR